MQNKIFLVFMAVLVGNIDARAISALASADQNSDISDRDVPDVCSKGRRRNLANKLGIQTTL